MRAMSKKHILLFQINHKRKRMYVKAKRFGFTHPEVVAVSQELDTLLNKYQRINSL
ncbi:aspartyl-phosphate phosphatase Spo0E family protein [Sporosarcina soli]|uniref:Aspartyl-phosphate phosphatase Spo0E family protein n=1 Tax=Sporosarcina soli TaxID=334736 RepID=A0ABW0TRA9_9BACL